MALVDSPMMKLLEPTAGIFTTAQEQQAFQYLQERSMSISSLSDCQFWDRVIVPAIKEDPAARHAVMALASMHEHFERTGTTSTDHDGFALNQYNLAIREHLNEMGSTRGDHASFNSNLAVCLLFLCIEMLQGHMLSALSLVKGARKLLNDHPSWDSFDGVESFIGRVEIQAVAVFGPQAIGHETLTRAMQAPFKINMPLYFSNLRDARRYLDLFVWCQTLSNPLREAFGDLWQDPAVLRAYNDLLTDWTKAFESLVLSMDHNLTTADASAIAVLRIRRLMAATNLDLALRYPGLQDEDTVWDECYATFAKVVQLAEAVVVAAAPPPSPPRQGGGGRYRFTLDASISGPLHDAARMCRDPVVRRRALQLLRSTAGREGLWDGHLAASVAERVIRLEESSHLGGAVTCAADVRAWARVGTVLTVCQQSRRAAFVAYSTQLPSTIGVTFQEEIVY